VDSSHHFLPNQGHWFFCPYRDNSKLKCGDCIHHGLRMLCSGNLASPYGESRTHLSGVGSEKSIQNCGLTTDRYYAMLKQPWSSIFSLLILKIVQAPAVAALVLCIIGATNASSPEQIDAQTMVHIGIVLYLVVLIILTLLAIGAWIGHAGVDGGEPRLVLAVLCALPFIFIRVLYSLLSAFSGSTKFNAFTGSQTIALFMSVLPEMAAAVIYIATGMKLEAVPAGTAASPGHQLVYRLGRGDFGFGKLGQFSLAAAAFQAANSHEARAEKDTGMKDKRARPRRRSAI
jgi:hypothetical protein